MPRIETILLRCRDSVAQKRFYIDSLGMSLRADGAVTYGAAQAGVMFEPAKLPYEPTSRDTYWKIALAVPNIEQAVEELAAKGIETTAPRQFRDVGYLAHFQDPEGFKIELIEHWFKGNRPPDQLERKIFGDRACLNLLTLRTHDIAPLRLAFLDWGMTALSVQPVDSHGFTLHFFAFTDEMPPNSDLLALENREWVYQRPHTVLEIQEVHDATPMLPTRDGSAGYSGARLSGTRAKIVNEQLGIRT
ncbi:MAG: VOC family protein [Arenibacterium sp.]